MLKVRYYDLRIDGREAPLGRLIDNARRLRDASLSMVSCTAQDVVLSYSVSRQVRTLSLLSDGTEVVREYPTIDRYRIRIFQSAEGRLFLSAIDPPRSARVVAAALDVLLPGTKVFFEPLAFNAAFVERHTRKFDVARLVSAKIKNFHVYDNAVGRLEVTSRTGLRADIAPFISGKFYEVDSLTYEVVSDLMKGLISYSSNGTVRVSGPIVEVAFPRLESCL